MDDNATRRYTVLGITDGVDEQGRRCDQLTGPLAAAVEYLATHQPAVKNALRMLGMGRFGRDRTLLEVETTLNDDNTLDATCRGPLAPLVGGKLEAGLRELSARRFKVIRRQDGQYSFSIYQPPMPSEAGIKIIGNIGLGRWTTGRPRVTTATLQITARCQADCFHCSAAKHKDRAKEELTTDEWKRVIRQAERLGVVNIVFTGGEPLLRPDLYELISWVDPKEATAMMFTNGLLLDDEHVAKLKEAGLYGLNVSLDSSVAEEHDGLRRVPGCFEKARQGIQRVKEAGMLVGISTYATPERLREGKVHRLIELGREWGVHEITIFDTVPTGKLLHHDRDRLLRQEDKDLLIRLDHDLNQDPSYPHIITQAYINGPLGSGCFAGWYQFYMTAYGDMMPCDFTPLAFGNARQEDLETIWSRLITHKAYEKPCNHCRMQDPAFRAAYIDRIPDTGPFPFPVELLESGIAKEQEAEEAVGVR